MFGFDMYREAWYAEGGIFSITSRILIVDLLSSMYKPLTGDLLLTFG